MQGQTVISQMDIEHRAGDANAAAAEHASGVPCTVAHQYPQLFTVSEMQRGHCAATAAPCMTTDGVCRAEQQQRGGAGLQPQRCRQCCQHQQDSEVCAAEDPCELA